MKKLLIILTVAAAGLLAACGPGATASPTLPAISAEPSLAIPSASPSDSSGASAAPSMSSGSSEAPSAS